MEDRAIYEILAPETEEKDTFKIDDDNKAEWALTVIRAEKEDMERLVAVCEQKRQEYLDKIELFKKQYESRTAYLVTQLQQYFETVEKKKTKTQETYELPSGRLKLKYPKPEIKRDDVSLLEWLKNNNMTEYVEVKESPKWGELKKVSTLSGDKYITDDGEIVGGVIAYERPPVFEVEV